MAPIGGFGRDLPIGVVRQNSAKPLPYQRVIVAEEQSPFGQVSHAGARQRQPPSGFDDSAARGGAERQGDTYAPSASLTAGLLYQTRPPAGGEGRLIEP